MARKKKTQQSDQATTDIAAVPSEKKAKRTQAKLKRALFAGDSRYSWALLVKASDIETVWPIASALMKQEGIQCDLFHAEPSQQKPSKTKRSDTAPAGQVPAPVGDLVSVPAAQPKK